MTALRHLSLFRSAVAHGPGIGHFGPFSRAGKAEIGSLQSATRSRCEFECTVENIARLFSRTRRGSKNGDAVDAEAPPARFAFWARKWPFLDPFWAIFRFLKITKTRKVPDVCPDDVGASSRLFFLNARHRFGYPRGNK